ncbi:MAG: hypothetical protein FMNOHCHN_03735 [Ignavibacteriaceae bacterium]|nr:hypothetical protein [Ignavibacteriaceae bacterium]
MANLKAYAKIDSEDEAVNRIQEQLEFILNPLIKTAILDGVLLRNVNLSTTPTRVEHKLNRKHLGYFIVDKDAAADVYSMQSSETMPNKFIKLVSTAPVNVSIWIF